MNSLLLISPDRAWGFKPILSGQVLRIRSLSYRGVSIDLRFEI